jgi:hypothetical protein
MVVVYKFTSSQAYKFTGLQVYKFTGLQVRSSQVYKFVG